jgi:hypothetical protein
MRNRLEINAQSWRNRSNRLSFLFLDASLALTFSPQQETLYLCSLICYVILAITTLSYPFLFAAPLKTVTLCSKARQLSLPIPRLLIDSLLNGTFASAPPFAAVETSARCMACGLTGHTLCPHTIKALRASVVDPVNAYLTQQQQASGVSKAAKPAPDLAPLHFNLIFCPLCGERGHHPEYPNLW